MYHVSAQGVDERLINVHYYYYYNYKMIHDKPTLRERKKLLAHFGTEKECRATPPGEVLTLISRPLPNKDILPFQCWTGKRPIRAGTLHDYFQ